jgi:hypothetical protein
VSPPRALLALLYSSTLVLTLVGVPALGSGEAHAAISNYTFVGFEGIGELKDQLDKRLGTTLNSTEHFINIEDCERYGSGEMEVTLRIDPRPTGNWQYAVAYAPPGKTCSTASANPEATAGTCIVPAAQRELTSSTITFNVRFDQLIGSDCAANTEGEASIYLIIQESSLSRVEFERIIVDVDLRAPTAPVLDTLSSGDARFQARWTDDTNDPDTTTWSVYWSDAAFGEDDLDEVDKRTGLTAKSVAVESGVSNDVTYYVSVVAIDEADNESALSNQLTVVPASTTDFWEGYVGAGGGEPGGFCFIATAAHGSTMAGDLVTLRAFRDRILMDSELGRSFVEAYYRHGRVLAAWIADKPVLRAVVRVLLVPVVWFAELVLWAGPVGAFALMLGAIGLLTVARRRLAAFGPRLIPASEIRS